VSWALQRAASWKPELPPGQGRPLSGSRSSAVTFCEAKAASGVGLDTDGHSHQGSFVWPLLSFREQTEGQSVISAKKPVSHLSDTTWHHPPPDLPAPSRAGSAEPYSSLGRPQA
jgi:hypothetical protein